MAKPVVTQERVFEIAQGMVERGEEPAILSVQAAIGGGSYSTVKRYLDLWKEQGKQRRGQVALPEAAVDRLMVLGREFWALLEERSLQQVEQIRVAAREEVGGLQTQVAEAEQAIGKLEAEREQLEQLAAERLAAHQALLAESQALRERVVAAEAKAGQLEARVGDVKAELDRVVGQLAAERQAVERARAEAQAAAVERAILQGELAALQKGKK